MNGVDHNENAVDPMDTGLPVGRRAVDGKAPSLARRRALLKTLGASPAVLTLVSNPVSASTCVVASSFVSALALASRKPASATPCAGKTPTGWGSDGTSWPNPYCGVKTGTTPASIFKVVFGNTTGTTLTATSTMMQACGSIGGVNGPLASYCTAALLNAQAYKVSTAVLTPKQVIQLWTDVTTNGYYVPTKGSKVRFNAAQCVTWLSSMMA